MKNLTRIHKHIIDTFSLDLSKKTDKGWLMSPDCCPWCGKDEDHFGIKLNYNRSAKYSNHISFHCFKCNEKGGEYKLLREIDQLHILKHGDYIDHSKGLERKSIISSEAKKISSKSPNMSPPIGYRPIKSSEYLNSRGFEPWQYELYSVGVTKIDFKLKDYVIFLIKEGGVCKGNVSRSTRSTEWIKEYNRKVKEYNDNRPEGEKKRSKYLRYRNDKAEFDKLLMGIDEVTRDTKMVILVEGVMDKANVDKLLQLNRESKTKCLCTFGKKVSKEQIVKIKKWGVNIKTVILIYDPDAMEDSKEISYNLSKAFRNVLVGYTTDNDPGDMNLDELNRIIDNAESPLNFKLNKLQKRELK